MEAVPRLPMLSFAAKKSSENIEFATKLKKYIRDHYNEDPDSYNNEIHEFEGLRRSAVNAPCDFTGCSTLKRYYCQLYNLASRFPLTEGGIELAFQWYSAFDDHQTTSGDITYEMENILYNIATLHMDLGAVDSRTTAEGMKISCTHFQCAAWSFQTLNQSLKNEADLNPMLMNFMMNVCLGQAQECILEKSMTDNRKPNIIAKVSMQVVEYLKLSAKHLESFKKSGSVLVEQIGSKLLKNWQRHLDFKITYYQSVTLFHQGLQSEEQQKMGERISFFQGAAEKLEEASKLSKNMENIKQISETLGFSNDVIRGKLTASQKENEFVYHEKIPPLDSLPVVKGASLVKGIPFSHSDSEVAGPDIFARLVPMEAHQESSKYSEEKAKLLRRIASQIVEKDDELQTYLASMQLDSLVVDDNLDTVPQELVDCCADLNSRDAMKELTDIMSNINNSYHDIGSKLNEIVIMTKEEEEREKEFKIVLGSKGPPNQILIETKRECEKYKEAHEAAQEKNMTLHKAILQHRDNISVLSMPLDKLLSSLPSIASVEGEGDKATRQEVQRLMKKVREMQSQRSEFESKLRNNLQEDDITKLLVTNKGDIEDFFKEELQKHSSIVSLLEQNMSAQDNILQALSEANAAYATTRRLVNQVKSRRSDFINSLLSSYNAFIGITDKAEDASDFYSKLSSQVGKLTSRIKSVCKVEEEQREEKLSANVKKFTGGTYSIYKGLDKKAPKIEPSSMPSGPKLKDFLQADRSAVAAVKNFGEGGLQNVDYSSAPTRIMPSVLEKPDSRLPYQPVPGVAYTSYPGASSFTSSAPLPPSQQSFPKTNTNSSVISDGMYPNSRGSPYKSIAPSVYGSTASTPISSSYHQPFSNLNNPNYNYSNTTSSISSASVNSNIPTNITLPSQNFSMGSNVLQYNQTSSTSNSPYAFQQTTHPYGVPIVSESKGIAPQTYQYSSTTHISSPQNISQGMAPQIHKADVPSNLTQGKVQNIPQYPPQHPAGVYPTSQQPSALYPDPLPNQQPTKVPYQPSSQHPGVHPQFPSHQQTIHQSQYSGLQQLIPKYHSMHQPSSQLQGPQQPSQLQGVQQPTSQFQGVQQPPSQFQGVQQKPNSHFQGMQQPTNLHGVHQPTSQLQGAQQPSDLQGVQLPTSQYHGVQPTAQLEKPFSQVQSIHNPYLHGVSQPTTQYLTQHQVSPKHQGITQPYQDLKQPTPQQKPYYQQAMSQPSAGAYANEQAALSHGITVTSPNQMIHPSGILSSQNYANYSQPDKSMATYNQVGSSYQVSSKISQNGNISLSYSSSLPHSTGTAAAAPSNYYPYSSNAYTNSHATTSLMTTTVNSPSNNQPQVYSGNCQNYIPPTSQSQAYQYALVSQPLAPTHSGSAVAPNSHVAPNQSASTTTAKTEPSRANAMPSKEGGISNLDLLSDIDLNLPSPQWCPLLPQAISSTSKISSCDISATGPDVTANVGKSSEAKESEQEKDLPNIVASASTRSTPTKTDIQTSTDAVLDFAKLAKQAKRSISVVDPLTNDDVLNCLALETERFSKYVQGLDKRSLNGPTNLELKWKELTDLMEQKFSSLKVSVGRCYPLKNRFADNLPFDHSRVQLPSTRDDYINASHVHLKYTDEGIPMIVTQAPMPNTFPDFWLMVLENQVETIVCLNMEAEVKGHVYLPQELNETLEFGSMTVTLKQVCSAPNLWWTRRTLHLTQSSTKISKVVLHLQFLIWPPSAMPETPGPLLQFIGEVHTLQKQQRNKLHPMVVHCIPGTGRSGIFAVLSSFIKYLHATGTLVDVWNLVVELCQQRRGGIHDRSYLLFLYSAAIYYAQDVLMKRGILTDKATFEEGPREKTHVRHPSADLLSSDLNRIKANLGFDHDNSVSAEGTNLNRTGSQSSILSNGSTKSSSHPNLEGGSTPSRNETPSPSHGCSSTNLSPSHSMASTDCKGDASDRSLKSLKIGSTSLPPNLVASLDPDQLKLEMPNPAKPKKITKDSFLNPSGSGLSQSEIELDPLNGLDPLWNLKKS